MPKPEPEIEKSYPPLDTVVEIFHSIFPSELSESWDASGLIVGRGDYPVHTVGFAVDATVATAQEAVSKQAQLLITHHPLLLKGASFLPASDYKGEVLHTLIENHCGLLGTHTNVDSAPHGTNEVFMDRLGIHERQVLDDSKEVQILGKNETVGIGRVGKLPQPITLKKLTQKIAEFLPSTASGLRVAGDADTMVQKIALCTGAGDSLFDAVRDSVADVYITADLRHHPASEARETARVSGQGKPCIIDCSHFASEWLWMDGAGKLLKDMLGERGYEIETYVSTLNTDPWDFVVSTGECKGSASTFIH